MILSIAGVGDIRWRKSTVRPRCLPSIIFFIEVPQWTLILQIIDLYCVQLWKYIAHDIFIWRIFWNMWNIKVIAHVHCASQQEQGKSEGFDSCDRPSNLKLDSNHQFFRPCDSEIWWMTLQNKRAPLLCYFKLCASFRTHWWIQTWVTVRNAQFGSKSTIFWAVWPRNFTDDLAKQ